MPIIRTKFRPWEDVDVSEEEAASMERMGLLSNIVIGDPLLVDEPETETKTKPDSAPAPQTTAEPPTPDTGRRTKTTSAPPEEVNTDGSSEEGDQEGSTQQEG